MTDRLQKFKLKEIVGDASRSPLQKYRDLFTGNISLAGFLYFEFAQFFACYTPGVLGLGLRKLMFPRLFQSCGRGVVFGHHIGLRRPKAIHLGRNCVLDDYVLLSCRGEQGQITVRDGVFVGQYTQIRSRDGVIEIDDGANISTFCHIGTAGHLKIGANCLLGSGCYIGGLAHGMSDPGIPIVDQPIEEPKGVTIEEDVWLGAHVIVNDGVTIGKGAVVGAGSVVTRDIAPGTINAGVPARVIRERGVDQ